MPWDSLDVAPQIDAATTKFNQQLNRMMSASRARFGDVYVKLFTYLSFANTLQLGMNADQRIYHVTMANNQQRTALHATFTMQRPDVLLFFVRWFYTTHLFAYAELFRKRFYALLDRRMKAGTAAVDEEAFTRDEHDGARYLTYAFSRYCTETLNQIFIFDRTTTEPLIVQLITDITGASFPVAATMAAGAL